MLIRVMLGLATACAAAVQPDSGVKHFQLSVPAAVEASQMHLLLRDVVVARNAPIVLRAYAVGADGVRVFLGTTALPAVSRDATGTATTSLLRMNVTSGMRRWRSAAVSASTVNIEIGSSGRDSTERVPWSVRAIELVRP